MTGPQAILVSSGDVPACADKAVAHAAGLLRFDLEEVTMQVAVLAASARTRPPARSGRAGSILRGGSWSAVVRYDSSQRQNRQHALERLAALVAGDRAEAEATRRVVERPEFREA